MDLPLEICSTRSGKSSAPFALADLARAFPLPWSHYVLLISRSRSPDTPPCLMKRLSPPNWKKLEKNWRRENMSAAIGPRRIRQGQWMKALQAPAPALGEVFLVAVKVNSAYFKYNPTKGKAMAENQNENPPPVQPSAPASPVVAVGEDKMIAILAYLTLIGFIVAIILQMNKKTKLGAFHLRQMLGLVLTGVAVGICNFILVFIPILGHLCILALMLALLVLWVMGLIAAVNGEMKPMPVVRPAVSAMVRLGL